MNLLSLTVNHNTSASCKYPAQIPPACRPYNVNKDTTHDTTIYNYLGEFKNARKDMARAGR